MLFRSDHAPRRIPLTRPSGTLSPSGGEGWGEGVRFRESFNLQHWTCIGAINLPSEFVLVARPSSSCSIFWRRNGFEDEDEGRGRARERLAEERFMGKVAGRPGEGILFWTLIIESSFRRWTMAAPASG